MATLTITKFSCIKEATFELANVNIIIGPQGSGKSVTTKLFYFFSNIIPDFLLLAEQGIDFDNFRRHITKQFAVWFPPSAWGSDRFNISYSADLFTVRVLRRMNKGIFTDEVSVTFSDWFEKKYRDSYDIIRRAGGEDEPSLIETNKWSDPVEKLWLAKNRLERQVSSELTDGYFRQQTFIPAGRAFFTSIGRLVAGLEQAGSLDPVTIRFARLFASIRDRAGRRSLARQSRLTEDFKERRKKFMLNLFGGELKYENDREYIETTDGRKVPFTSLSSGQQELLPMWSLIDYFQELEAWDVRHPVREKKFREVLYIEEPEAHLFPSAQSQLMQFLISLVSSERNHRHLVLTTHSPYIMGQLNVYLKAGQLAKRKKNNREINEVVPRECWLNDKQISAFAIQDMKLVSIMDDDGLIDATYLDAISEETSQQFSQLLRIESEML